MDKFLKKVRQATNVGERFVCLRTGGVCECDDVKKFKFRKQIN